MERDLIVKNGGIAVVTDCVVFAFDGRRMNALLLARRGEHFQDGWALPEGLIGSDETAKGCVKRVVKEEVGLDVFHIEEIGTFSELNRDPRGRVISIAYLAVSRDFDTICQHGIRKARWFRLDSLPEFTFDYKSIVECARVRLREQVAFEPVAFEFLDKTFTMTQLQRVYEEILGVKLDRRNFYRKVLFLGLLERVDPSTGELIEKTTEPNNQTIVEEANPEKKRAVPSRLPYYYRFNRDRYEELKRDGHGFKLEF